MMLIILFVLIYTEGRGLGMLEQDLKNEPDLSKIM